MKLSYCFAAIAAALACGCTAEDLEAFNAALAESTYGPGAYGAGYGAPGYGAGYGAPGYGSGYAPGYAGYPTYYPAWPVPSVPYNSYVGAYGCKNIGSFYSCDSNGDGYIDMFGDTDDGSYYAPGVRVNGRGEGFSYDRNCSCWTRDRTLDGPYKRRPHHDRYHDDDDYDG